MGERHLRGHLRYKFKTVHPRPVGLTVPGQTIESLNRSGLHRSIGRWSPSALPKFKFCTFLRGGLGNAALPKAGSRGVESTFLYEVDLKPEAEVGRAVPSPPALNSVCPIAQLGGLGDAAPAQASKFKTTLSPSDIPTFRLSQFPLCVPRLRPDPRRGFAALA